jgi:hypothetical protein
MSLRRMAMSARRCWGVELTNTSRKEQRRETPLLLGLGWHGRFEPRYPGEPGRALLFTTRSSARDWSKSKNDYYQSYPMWHMCHAWHFRVVRVTVTMRVQR